MECVPLEYVLDFELESSTSAASLDFSFFFSFIIVKTDSRQDASFDVSNLFFFVEIFSMQVSNA